MLARSAVLLMGLAFAAAAASAQDVTVDKATTKMFKHFPPSAEEK